MTGQYNAYQYEIPHAHPIETEANTLQLPHKLDAPGGIVITKRYFSVVIEEGIKAGIRKSIREAPLKVDQGKIPPLR